MSKEKKTLLIQREAYEAKDGQQRFSYFVQGKLRGKDIRASIVPTDINGYTLLDVVYVGCESAELVVSPYEMQDEATGQIIRGNTYSAKSTDESGETYECPVKPRQKSDKAILEMLLARL